MVDTIQIDRADVVFIREHLIMLTSLLRQRQAISLAETAEWHANHLTELLNDRA